MLEMRATGSMVLHVVLWTDYRTWDTCRRQALGPSGTSDFQG